MPREVVLNNWPSHAALEPSRETSAFHVSEYAGGRGKALQPVLLNLGSLREDWDREQAHRAHHPRSQLWIPNSLKEKQRELSRLNGSHHKMSGLARTCCGGVATAVIPSRLLATPLSRGTTACPRLGINIGLVGIL